MARFAQVVDGVVTEILDATEQDMAAGIVGPCAEWVDVGTVYNAPTDSFMSYADIRVADYGTARQQIESIIENGLTFEQDRVAAIKLKHPKPV